MKKLTVMVSLYNSGLWIENRLNNLFNSTAINEMEIWCVNANSPDPLDDIIPAKYDVQYLKLPERVGVYAAWNHIIQASNSYYITNANTDDLIAPNGYERLMSVLDNNHGFGFAYPSWYTSDIDNLQWPQVPKKADHTGGDPGNYSGDLGLGGVGHFPLYRRNLHNQYGLFDERFKALGDADFWSRCYHYGKTKFIWVKEHLACYLWRGARNEGDRNLWHKEINQNEWDLYHSKAESYKQGKL